MLRRTSLSWALFSSAGGSAPRSKRPAVGAGTKDAAAEPACEATGQYLPWTARPWAMTYRVHYSQWKFVDTVFAHLATVAPAVLNEHAQQQGVRDVLCELEEPAVALRRRQARQARQLKKQKAAAAAAAITADALPTPAQMPAPVLQGKTTTLTVSPSATASSRVSSDCAVASETMSTLGLVPGVAPTHEAVDRHAALLNATKELKDSCSPAMDPLFVVAKRAVSIHYDDYKTPLPIPIPPLLPPPPRCDQRMNKCFKCKQGIGTVVSRDGPSKLYCTDCFLAYCAGVVRENILQQCRVPSDTPLAVAVSGGPNSMMMLYELGQMRHKAHEHIRRQQQRQQPAQQERACREGEHWEQTPQRKVPTVGTSSISNLILLPFHLCEDELVLPPPPPSSSPSTIFSRIESSGRHEAIQQVRATMMEQFTTLRKYVQQQPPRWVCHDEVCVGRKKKKEKHSVTAKEEMAPGVPLLSMKNDNDPRTSSWPQSPRRHTRVGGETTAAMFGEAEMRVFHYSDFLPDSYVREVRHSIHASRLSLGDREALYARVRQQTLCRAAQRVCTEYLQREADSGAVSGSAAGEEFAHRDDAHTSPPDTSSKTWSHLLLGSNAVRCATAALEALVTGASGEGVVHGAGFRGFTHEVVCLRPLRTMLPRETVMYTRLCGISCDYTPALRTATAAPSVHRTLERFVLTMMASYRTMIFNVLNTVQKLEVHPAAMRTLVCGTVDTHASDAHTDRDGSAGGVRGSLQSSGKTCRRSLPSRTAQQNRDDLRQTAPPSVHRDSHGMNTKEPSINEAVAMCCVCGLPAPAPVRKHPLNETAEERQSLLFAMNTTDPAPPSSTTAVAAASSEVSAEVVSCFICYACRALSDAWPPSIFGETSAKDRDSLTHEKSGNAMSPAPSTLRLCKLFR